MDNISTYVYADDITFYSPGRDLHDLYQRLRSNLVALDNWLSKLHLSLNVKKCAFPLFTVTIPYHYVYCTDSNQSPKLHKNKYLGIVYDGKLTWRPYIKHVAAKGERAAGVFRRLCKHKLGLRRDTPLMTYPCYVRPVLEFGCVLFLVLRRIKYFPISGRENGFAIMLGITEICR